MAVHRLDEPVQPFGNGMNLLQPFAVDMMPEEYLWAYRPSISGITTLCDRKPPFIPILSASHSSTNRLTVER